MFKNLLNLLNGIFGGSQGGNQPQAPQNNGGGLKEDLEAVSTFAEWFAKFSNKKGRGYRAVRYLVWLLVFLVFSGNLKETIEGVILLGEFMLPIFKSLFVFYGDVLESFDLITLKEKVIATTIGLNSLVVVHNLRKFLKSKFNKKK